jgi:hypothetical protein
MAGKIKSHLDGANDDTACIYMLHESPNTLVQQALDPGLDDAYNSGMYTLGFSQSGRNCDACVYIHVLMVQQLRNMAHRPSKMYL